MAAMEIEGSALTERQFPQEWQIDAGLTRKVVVDGVCMLIRLVGQFQQRQREIRRDRHGCKTHYDGRRDGRHRSVKLASPVSLRARFNHPH